MTATPVQRVVLLYDRLMLDLGRARDAEDAAACAPHLQHAALILSELADSLDESVGGPSAGLSSLYIYGLRQVLSAQLTGFTPALEALAGNLGSLRDAWCRVADGSHDMPAMSPSTGSATPMPSVGAARPMVTAATTFPATVSKAVPLSSGTSRTTAKGASSMGAARPAGSFSLIA